MIKKPPNGKPISSASELFERHTLKTDGCWEWQAYRNKAGYGFTRVGGRGSKGILAHRLSWEVNRGRIPEGLHVLHRCDNPACVRPDHLFLGTNTDNIKDRLAKDRPMTGRASIPDKTVEEIRFRCMKGESQRSVSIALGVSQPHISMIASGEKRRKPRWL